MKNHIASLLLMLVVAGSLASCREESKLPAPKISGSVPLIFPQISSDPAKAYFDYDRARLSTNNLNNPSFLPNIKDRTRPVFEFSFNLDNTRDKKVKVVEVYKSFYRPPSFGPRVLYGSYSSFPVTISLTSQDALTDLQRVITGQTPLPYLLNVKGANNVQANNLSALKTDAVVFTFEYILEDDSRVILTPVINTAVGPAPGGTPPATSTVPVLAATTQVNAPFAVVATFRDKL